ncbi:hypothetical protein M413DRAFT_449471 [Hebeloma cylindrosporum]|uniref:Uncharacterized protein n=1 Tax=Hebeloma cylindrosporum TaxID=76867 RepID=A0A0C2Y4P6_HEBCY|nr:hypothetical protein M413DRAFT_449471 [Hebeloma cylindrosporum h7]
MSRILAFTGDNQNASDWLKIVDRTVAMRNNDRGKLEIFAPKLAVDSPADRWFSSIPVKIRKNWRMVRDLFVLKWVEKAEQQEIDVKVNEFLQELGHSQSRSATRDILFVEPLPPSSPVPIAFDLARLRRLITASDVDNVSIFCAKTAGTEHEYFAHLWQIAFEAGKKLNTTVPHLNVGIQAIPIPQSDPSPKVDSSTQTTEPPAPLAQTDNILVDVPLEDVSPPSPVSRLDWAEDATSLPIAPLLPTPSVPRQHAPRDFSSLRSSRPNPFGSLQRRSRQSRPPVSSRFSWTVPFTRTLHPCYGPPPLRPQSSFPKPRVPLEASRNEPTIFSKLTPPSSLISALNWDQDPRLSDLSRALKALGWIRP